MHWQYSMAIWPSLIAAAVAVLVAFFVWRRRPAPGATVFTFLALALALWSVSRALLIAAADLPTKVLLWKSRIFWAALVPTSWLVFTVQYSGKGKWLTRRRYWLLAVEPLVVAILCWTNESHNLFFGDAKLETRGSLTELNISFEPAFWFHAAYSYSLIVLGIALLLWALRRAPRLYRRQVIGVLAGCAIAAVADLVTLAGLSPLRGVDMVAWSFTFVGIMTAWGLFRFRLLDVVPVARDRLIEELGDGVIVLDPLGRILDLNPAAANILLPGSSQAIGQPVTAVMADQPLLLECCRDRGITRAEISLGEGESLRHYDLRVSPLYDRSGRDTGRLIVLRDISERKRVEEQLKHNAFHDSLTGLPNRALFMDRLEFALKRSERRGDFHFAVLFLDLDRFKVINDSLGHVTGDELLIAVAQRLQSCVRQVDTVARLGGDEFVILLEDSRSVDGVSEVARRVQRKLGLSVTLGGRDVFTSASIGIVFSTGQYRGRKAEDVVRDADIALYRAKEMGRACYALFDGEMHEHAMRALQMETDLHRAVEQQEFEIHYQPIVSIESGRLIGFEALIRWRHPTLGLLLPGAFMPFAEDTNLILAIDRWVLKKTCEQLADWERRLAAGSALSVSVNLSGRELNDPTLPDFVSRVLRDTGIAPGNLVVELTETVLLKDLTAAAATLHRLKSLGVQLYLDDFGTGYSSLSVLHRLPIDKLKIDRSFIRDLEIDKGLEIVKTIVTLCRNLNKGVIAEGVETRAELDRLRELGCDYAQGYLFSRPMIGEKASSFLAERLDVSHWYNHLALDSEP